MGVIQVVQEAETVAKVTETISLSTIRILLRILFVYSSPSDPTQVWRQLLCPQRRATARLAEEAKSKVGFHCFVSGHWLCSMLCPHHFSQNRFDAAVERFMLSCAGYCVATYVLVSS